MPFFHGNVPSRRRNLIEINIYSDAIFQRVDDDTQFLSQVRSASSGGDTNDSHSLSTDEKARPRLRAYLDKYFSKARHLVVAYAISDGEKSVAPLSADNIQTQWKKRSIWLTMPSDWDTENRKELALSISDYIVSGIEYEFLLIAYGATDGNTLQRLDALNAASAAITSCLSLRTPAQRPIGYPAFR